MTKNIETPSLDLIHQRAALAKWEAECKRRFELRFPKIDFHSYVWPIRKEYGTKQSDINFTAPMADFAGKDISYITALRCLVAEIVIAGEPKDIYSATRFFRQLVMDSPDSLFDISLVHLRRIEERQLAQGKMHPPSANRAAVDLRSLSQYMTTLSRNNVLPVLGWQPKASTSAELRKLHNAHKARRKAKRGELLDRKMEAFGEAVNRMRAGAPELSPRDRVAIALGIILLCAPSRINEPLCMSIDDYVKVDDYVNKVVGEGSEIERAHQMLILTKGGKGAPWSPKPVLSFMMDAFTYAMDVIKSHGERSRMLVEWYQKNPDTLYLPPDLEQLRGKNIDRYELMRIIKLNSNLPKSAQTQVTTASKHFNEICRAADPNYKPPSRGKKSGVRTIPWADIEAHLLKKVHEAMARCYRVTSGNHYIGDLSKMLFLFDNEGVTNNLPYLPGSIQFSTIGQCFKTKKPTNKFLPNSSSFFEKLGITMPVDGQIQTAWMDTHDPRRWLTTMALTHGEKLSDVLINKWANRLSLAQLKDYDYRSAETKAEMAAMPDAEKLSELSDLANGIASLEKLEEQFGLQTTFVTAHDAGVSVTSLDAVAEAVEDRPVAQTSHGIIVIYPQKFGVCMHQHHEKPCRNFSNELSGSCLPCSDGVQQKGHIPTNDAVRQENKKLFNIIVQHLEHLAITHNRGIADDPAMLGEHMLTLVEKGLSPLGIEQLAHELIDNFEEAKRILKDRRLANLLETAYVARQSVAILDDPATPSGALYKYHNPKRHAEPLFEIALDEHGGREQVARDEQALIEKYPVFAATTDRITDERHLIAADEVED